MTTFSPPPESKFQARGTWGTAVTSRLKDLTSAYLAIEGLINSPLLSDATKEQLKKTLEALDAETAIELKHLAEQDHLHKLRMAS